MKSNDIVGLRYDFVKLILNGKDLGIYAIEEHFDKRLLENNSRKEGPIIKFSEEVFWETLAKNKKAITQKVDKKIYLRSHIDGYKKSSNETHSDNSNYRKAISMLSEYRNGDIEFNQIFDIDIFARHYALSRVFSAEHGERWHNRRFYYNSITDKLEPIGFDGDALFNVDTINDLFQSKMHFSWMEKESNNFELISTIAKYLELFSDTDFLSAYEEEINYYERIFLGNFLKVPAD